MKFKTFEKLYKNKEYTQITIAMDKESGNNFSGAVGHFVEAKISTAGDDVKKAFDVYNNLLKQVKEEI